MKKIILIYLLLFTNFGFSQSLTKKIDPNSLTNVPHVSTNERLSNKLNFPIGKIVYDKNLEAYYRLSDEGWILNQISKKNSVSTNYFSKLSDSLNQNPSANSILVNNPNPGAAIPNDLTNSSNSANSNIVGGILFFNSNSTYSSSSNLYWNDTSSYLGIGTTSPISPLQVKGLTSLDSIKINNLYIGDRNRSNNIAIGAKALNTISSGTNNIGLGHNALHNTTTGGDNIGIGQFSVQSNTTGRYNIGIGTQALRSISTGNNNIALGVNSMRSNSTGNKNISLGDSSAFNLSSGINNIAIGSKTSMPNPTGSNQLVIGNALFGKNIHELSSSKIGIGTTNPTASLHVEGTFRYQDGAPGHGKVLTSDVHGNASWVGNNYVTLTRTRDSLNIPSGTNLRVDLNQFSLTGTFRGLSLDLANSRLVNSTNRPITVRIVMNQSIVAPPSGNFVESDFWIQKNSNTVNATNRIAQKGIISSHSAVIDQVEWEGILGANEFVNFWTWASGSIFNLPTSSFGNSAQTIRVIEVN